MHIESLVPRGRAHCLEVVCADMSIAEAIHDRAERTDWRCIDVDRREPAAFDGRTMNYNDGEFDVAVLCDVLHHAPKDAARLLAEAARVARSVIVKDHFAQGTYSRTMLGLVDSNGDLDGRIGAPQRSLTRDGFVSLAVDQGLVITALDCALPSADPPPAARASSQVDSDFIAVLHRD
jgi:Methyltransferase domain